MANVDDVALQAESLAPLINTLAILFVVFSTVSVALRLYTRKQLLDAVGPDDVSIGIAQVLAIVCSVTTVMEVFWGLGRHTKFVDPIVATKQLKCLYANIMIYNAAQILTKVSFLIQYRRLFPGRKIRKICFYLLMFIVAWGLTQEFIVGFSCMPLTQFATSMVGKCIYTLPVWYLTSCMNIVTDFIVFIIPVVPVLKLQIRMRQKLLLLALFCLGFFTCAISLVRLSTLHKGIKTQDPFWDNAPAAYWSVVELNCGIICACLPTLRPLIQKVIPDFWSTRHSTRDGTAKSGTVNSQGLRTFNSTFNRRGRDLEADGIYVQKEIELHSTTELRSNAASYERSSVEETGSSKTYIIGDSKGSDT